MAKFSSVMELRHLRYFVAVAEELNFTRAAEKLHLAQPSLTRQIHNLEEELGVRLLNRTKSVVTLTEEGRSFLIDARKLVAQSVDGKLGARQRRALLVDVGGQTACFGRQVSPLFVDACKLTHQSRRARLLQQ